MIAVDLSEQASKDVSRFSPYPMATEADLEETARLVPWNEARDVSEAVLWLASDQARHVTGIVLPIDAGQLAK